MSVAELLKQGKVTEALAKAEDAVRNDPSTAKPRVLLFQILAILGKWERALAQLDVAGKLDAKNLLTVQMCRQLILCERLRADVFAGKRSPLVLGEPEEWLGWMIQAAQLTAQGKLGAGAEIRAKALAAASTSAGEINGTRFEWIADADSRLGPILEVLVDGNYYWAPMHRVRELVIEPPTDLRDLIWIPSTFTWVTGATQEGFIPARYVGSDAATDQALALSRRTDWRDLDGGATFVGLGQRMFATDAGEFPLLEIRSLTFDAPPGTSTPAGDVNG